MENIKQRNMVFANLQELLASLPERERHEFLKYLNKHEIIGNQTLEPIILFQYNAALFADAAAGQMQDSADAINDRLSAVVDKFEQFRMELENSIQSQVNIAIERLNGAVGETVETTNTQIGKLNNTVVNLVDNISAYIDTSMAKMLEQVADERVNSVSEIKLAVEAIKKELEVELQKMLVEVGVKIIKDELKKSVKEPIATHLQKYLGLVKERTSQLDNAVQGMSPWNLQKLVRDFVLYGGTILLFKFLHFI